ncbi:Uncharacterised protein [Mycobacteroides abscessus subsp. abscessus]|nr:Uncharacterised protein [Mycobacteroides abscessus subsp. abscessus]
MTMSARSTAMTSEVRVEGRRRTELFQSKMSAASIRPAETISTSSSGSDSTFVTVSSGAASRSLGSAGTRRPRMPVENPPIVMRPRGSPERARASASMPSRSWRICAPRLLSSRPMGVREMPRPERSVTGAPR